MVFGVVLFSFLNATYQKATLFGPAAAPFLPHRKLKFSEMSAALRTKQLLYVMGVKCISWLSERKKKSGGFAGPLASSVFNHES